MLDSLKIQNIALIDKSALEFTAGFTVFTGETGAGKSMLMDALSLVLGSRGGASFVRHGQDSASIEAIFTLPAKHPVMRIMEEQGLEPDDGELILRRQITADGKGKAFVNGMRVTLTQLKELGDRLADIHGQHDHQLLLKSNMHTRLLDRFGGYTKELEAVKSTFKEYKQVKDELERLEQKAADREREIETLTAYVSELDRVAPQVGEEEELSIERTDLMAAEKAGKGLRDAQDAMNSHDNPLSQLSQMERMLISSVPHTGHERLEALINQFSEVSSVVADLSSELDILANDLAFDPERLADVDERLFLIKDLARKHRCMTDELPEVHQKLKDELDQLENAEENMQHLQKALIETKAVFDDACKKLSLKREAAAVDLKKALESELKDLKMEAARFEARLESLEDKANAQGAEQVSFYVSTNPGQPFAQLEKVASGGEVSRLMLALKTVFYAHMPETTLVFDEIDTGVGGAVADAVGRALKKLSEKHQVFSITHMPQVAALGNKHMNIVKSSSADKTVTDVKELSVDQRIDEVARMLSGAAVTDATREAARSLMGA